MALNLKWAGAGIAATVVAAAGVWWATSPNPRDRALEVARIYVRNAVGDQNAPVWDEKVCWLDDDRKHVSKIAGLINSKGTGQRQFVVDFTGENPDGPAEVEPIGAAEDEGAYWREIASLRRRDDGHACSDWMSASSAAGIYWHARKDGLSEGEARLKVMKDLKEIGQIQAGK